MNKFSFERKLSLDGVAIIIGVITALIWIGALEQKISDLERQGADHTTRLTELSGAVAGVKSDVAVLSTVISERTGKPVREER